MYGCFHVYLCLKRELDPLELELCIALSCHVGAGIWTHIPGEEQSGLLNAEISLNLPHSIF